MATMKQRLYNLLRWSERYTKTDMVYLFGAGFWSNVNALAITFFSLILYIVYAHFLSKETYGTYQYLLSLFSIATAFTLTGMNSAVVRSTARGHEGTLRASIPLQLKYGLIPLLGALILAGYYLHGHNLVIALGLIIIGLCTAPLYAFNTYGAFLAGKKDFRSNAVYGIVSSGLYYGALCLAAVLFNSPLVLLGVNLVVQVLLYYFIYRLVLRKHRPNRVVDSESLTYGLHLSAMSVFGSVAGQLGNIYIFHFLGPAPLALYSFATAPPERLGNLFFKFLGGATLPKFSERTPEEIRSQMLRKIGLAMLAGTAVALAYIALAYFFFALFFPSYLSAVPYSMVCALGLIFAAAIYIPTTALTALKRTRGLYIMNIVNPIVQIIVPLAGVLLGGLWGYLIAHLITIVFALVFSTILVFRTGIDSTIEPA